VQKHVGYLHGGFGLTSPQDASAPVPKRDGNAQHTTSRHRKTRSMTDREAPDDRSASQSEKHTRANTGALHLAGRAAGAGERVTLSDAQPHTPALDLSQQRTHEGDPA
jgi:hypothetical protein